MAILNAWIKGQEYFFVGLGKSSNASKGAHSWADWKGHSKMGEVPDNGRMEMLL
jgi:hypothetical protein